jgi:hypothetical protein
MYNSRMAKTKQTAIRLSDTDEKILEALKDKKGVSGTAVLIMALREMAERENIKIVDEAKKA